MDEVTFGECAEEADTSAVNDCPFSVSLDIEDNNNKHIVPNPFLVTIHNLRDVVIALASTKTPLIERMNFMHRNPLPNAVFEDNLLTNPDEIMPSNYDDKSIQKDCLSFQRMINRMSIMYGTITERVD